MTTTVSYNGSKLQPVQTVNISKSYQTTGDGTKVGSLFTIAINGTLHYNRGTPRSLIDGTLSNTGWGGPSLGFWTIGGDSPDETITDNQRLASLIRKQELIRELFSEDGYTLEVQGYNLAPLKCNPRILSVDFQEDKWHTVCAYTITCEADVIYVNNQLLGEDSFSEYISSASESWNIETQEQAEGINLPRTYKLTHSVEATGKRFYDATNNLEKPAWQQARDFVTSRLGWDASFINLSDVQDLPSSYGGYNHTRGENLDKYGGTYSVSESWLLANGSALEDIDINTEYSTDNGLNTVTINGTITGLEERDSDMNLTVSKYDNAHAQYVIATGDALQRAQNYSGLSLNMDPVSYSIGKNPVTGVITYTFTYNDRPSNLIPEAASEHIQVSWNGGGQTFAAIPVLGRADGPVLQDLNSKNLTTKSLSIDLVFTDALDRLNPVLPTGSILNVVNQARPSTAIWAHVFDGDVQESLTNDGRGYHYDVSWTYGN